MSGFGSNNTSQAGGNTLFNGNRQVTRAGLPSVNVGGENVVEWLERYFFPAVAPGASLTGGNTRLFGDATAIALNWTAIRQTNPILEINVAGDNIAVTGNTQSGIVNRNATQNINTTFSMTVKSVDATINAQTILFWSHFRYWGRIAALPGGGIPIPTDAQIQNADGAGVGTGKEFASSRAKAYGTISPNGSHLFIVIHRDWGVPSFVHNGLPNSSWTEVRNNDFTNMFGFISPFRVFVTNNPIAGSFTLTVN